MLMEQIVISEKDLLSVEEAEKLFGTQNGTEKNLCLIEELKEKRIDPNETLRQSICQVKEKKDLIPVSLSLRYGADPNFYVLTPEVGNIHILAFVYLVLGEPSYQCLNNLALNSVLMILSASGSDSNLPVFKNCKMSVLEWLCQNNYQTILPFCFENVKPEASTLIGSYLDDTNLIQTQPNTEDVISSYSDIILSKYEFDVDEGIKFSVKYLNFQAFQKFIDLGAVLKYYQINRLLLDANCISFQMLLYAVNRGTIIDQRQLDLLPCGSEKRKELICVYEQPLWRKNCQVVNGVFNKPMKKLVYCLNLNPEYPKKKICTAISKISMANKEEVKKAVVKRQEQRITATLSDYLSFIGCEPSIEFEKCIDYPDNDICFYKDVENRNWIFTRDQFEEILKDEINPYTGEKIPQLLKDEMEKRNLYFMGLFQEYFDPISICHTIEILNECDKIHLLEYRERNQEVNLDEIVNDEVNLNLPEDLKQATISFTLEEFPQFQLSLLGNEEDVFSSFKFE